MSHPEDHGMYPQYGAQPTNAYYRDLPPQQQPPPQPRQRGAPGTRRNPQYQPDGPTGPPPQQQQYQNPAVAASRQKSKAYSTTIAAHSDDLKYQGKYRDLKRKVREIEAVRYHLEKQQTPWQDVHGSP